MKIVAFTLGTQKRISFTKENSNGFIEAYQLNTRDMFRPELRMAYEKAKDFLLEAFSTFKFAKADALIITAMGIQWDKDFPLMMKKVRFNITLNNKMKDVCKIQTSWIQVTEKNQAMLEPIVDEIEAFVNGERAQGKLFIDDIKPVPMATQRHLAEYETDEFDADDVKVFHVNDITVKGVTQ